MRYSRSHIAAIALGLLLTVLGHDALMAADPHPFANAGHHESPVPVSVTDCGPTIGGHPKPSTELDIDDLTVCHSLLQATEELTGFLPHWSVAPDHPPETRRALLQVYLN